MKVPDVGTKGNAKIPINSAFLHGASQSGCYEQGNAAAAFVIGRTS